jgi:uncharacterized Zn finger protein
MRFDDWEGFHRFPPSRPREAKGGIRAASKRGSFGESWWARRWLEVLESFDIGARLRRGRSYARKGQVLSIDIKKGMVEAAVQGSRPEPYQVTIKVRPLMPSEWKRMAAELSREAIFAAKLLAGEMPQDIERAFTGAGLSLFPESGREIATACSCPDWSNPCKHVAAVYYLLGEAFDSDPFLIFRLRGMDRDEFTSILFESGAAAGPAAEPAAGPEPLTPEPQHFWAAPQVPADLLAGVEIPKVGAALPRRLGNIQFWRGELPLVETLEPVYETAARRGEALVLGEKSTQ